MKAKVDLEKFICSYVKWSNIQDALKDQGLKCWNGEIVEIPQESEDEKIRGKVIAIIHLYYGEPLEDEAKEMIAWLEKQGEQNKIEALRTEYEKGRDDAIAEMESSRSEEDEKIRKEILEHIQLCTESIPDRDKFIAWLKKQGETKV